VAAPGQHQGAGEHAGQERHEGAFQVDRALRYPGNEAIWPKGVSGKPTLIYCARQALLWAPTSAGNRCFCVLLNTTRSPEPDRLQVVVGYAELIRHCSLYGAQGKSGATEMHC
jgi:hypothetical protein